MCAGPLWRNTGRRPIAAVVIHSVQNRSLKEIFLRGLHQKPGLVRLVDGQIHCKRGMVSTPARELWSSGNQLTCGWPEIAGHPPGPGSFTGKKNPAPTRIASVVNPQTTRKRCDILRRMFGLLPQKVAWILMFASVVVAPLLGFVLLCVGLVGRRVGEHQVCAECGFDLRGRPVGSQRCPECGRDLHGGIVTGDLIRRPVMATVGATILLLWLLIIISSLAGIDIDHYKPVGMLQWEVDRSGAYMGANDLNELLRRAKSGAFSAAQLNNLADWSLAHQANLQEPWNPRWGDLIEAAHVAGALPQEKWILYAKQAFSSAFKVEVRPKVHRGDPIPVRITNLNSRAGNSRGQLVREVNPGA